MMLAPPRRHYKTQTSSPKNSNTNNPYKGLTLQQYFLMQKDQSINNTQEETITTLACEEYPQTPKKIQFKINLGKSIKPSSRFKTQFEENSVNELKHSLILSNCQSEQASPFALNKKKEHNPPFLPNLKHKRLQSLGGNLSKQFIWNKPPKMSSRFLTNHHQMNLIADLNKNNFTVINRAKKATFMEGKIEFLGQKNKNLQICISRPRKKDKLSGKRLNNY